MISKSSLEGVLHGGAANLAAVFSPMTGAVVLDGIAVRRRVENCETNQFCNECIKVQLVLFNAVVLFDGLADHVVDLSNHVCKVRHLGFVGRRKQVAPHEVHLELIAEGTVPFRIQSTFSQQIATNSMREQFEAVSSIDLHI